MLTKRQRDNINERLDIIKIISEYTDLERRGTFNFIGLCPFHYEKTPSFTAHILRGKYKCFGCGAKGDTLDFLMSKRNLNLDEALIVIALEFDIWWSDYGGDTQSE